MYIKWYTIVLKTTDDLTGETVSEIDLGPFILFFAAVFISLFVHQFIWSW
jgi:hypothetical protein